MRFSIHIYLWVIASLLLTANLFSAPKYVDFQVRPTVVTRSQDEITLDGIRWGCAGKNRTEPIFKRTTIKLGKVREVYYWSQKFFPEMLAAHGMIAFVMENQECVKSDDGARDIGIVLSVEAHFEEGQRFSFIGGLQKTYPLHYQLTTYGDRIQDGMYCFKSTLHQYKLTLSDEQKELLFQTVIDESLKDWSKVWYNTLSNSCVWNCVRVINLILPEEEKLPMWRLPGKIVCMKASLPNLVPKYLVENKLAVEAEKIEPGIRFHKVPCDDGDDYILNVAAQHEGHVASSQVALAERLDLFLKYSEACEMLVKLQSLIPINNPKFFAYQSELVAVEELLSEYHDSLLALFEADLEESLKLYTKIDLPKNYSVQYFNESLLAQAKTLLPRLAQDQQERVKSLLAKLQSE